MWRYTRGTINKVNSVFLAALILVSAVAPLAVAMANNPFVTLSSFSGNPGVTLQVSGGNFHNQETVDVTATQNNKIVAKSTATAGEDSLFMANIALPVLLQQGPVTVEASGVSSGLRTSNSYYVNPYNPSVSINTNASKPFSQILVSGSGFASNELVSINIAGEYNTIKVDATGAFTDAPVMTPHVPAASYQVVVVGQSSMAKAIGYHYIDGFYASAAPSSYYVLPLEALSFNGSGFAANELVTVATATSGEVLSTFTADATGSFKKQGVFNVPAKYSGTDLKVVLTGATSKASTTTGTVVGRYYPSVSPTDYYVVPGGSFGFNGSGFVPGERISISHNGIEVNTATADSYGSIKAAGTVTSQPEQAGAAQTYVLTGKTSSGSGTVSVQIGSYNPLASPSSYYIEPGKKLSFTGSGFQPNEVVYVMRGATKVSEFNANVVGGFTSKGATMIDYTAANSSVAYTLVGASSKSRVAIAVSVGQLNVLVSPSSYYVLPHEPFSVSAQGLAPNEDVALYNGKQLISTASTDEDGVVTFQNVSVASSPSGSATLSAIGVTSKATGMASVGIGNYYPTLSFSTYYTQSGSEVMATGSGFIAGESVQLVEPEGSSTYTADANGVVTATVRVPFGTSNSVDFTMSGSKSNASVTATITVAPYNVTVSPSTYYAQPGTPLTFSGSGYVSGETISIVQNKTVVITATADSNGAFTSQNIELPFGASAQYSVVSSISATKHNFEIGLAQFYAGVQLSDYYGNGGSQITASGSGYAANEAIAITSGSQLISQVTADKTGQFTQQVAVPYGSAGKVAITATGVKSGATATTYYTLAQVYSNVQMQHYAVKAATAITVLGSGFLANDRVSVTADRGSLQFSALANANGGVVITGPVPASLPEGPLTLTITGANSFTTSEITIYIQDKNAQ